jgi:protein TonB
MKTLKFISVLLGVIAFTFGASAQNGLALNTVNPSKTIVKRLNAAPEFQGGMEELSNYLNKNLKYPYLAKKQGIEGKVIVEFSITERGEIKEIKLQNSLIDDLDREAIRLIKNMPRWQPAVQNGIPQKIRYQLPIQFTLN